MKYYKFVLVFLFILLLNPIIYPIVIKVDSLYSVPNYRTLSSTKRVITDFSFHLYYEQYPQKPKFIAVITLNQNNFWPNLIDIPVQNPKYVNFKAIYYLKNSFVQINDFTSFPEDSLDPLNMIDNYKIVDLLYDPVTNSLQFPTITHGLNPNLHLALNAFYVLIRYLSQPPIDKYFKMWNYPIPVTIDFNGLIQYCFYDPYKLPLSRDLNVSTTLADSYLDSVYKHEYGHHIFRSIFGIMWTKYTPDYDAFRSCDEQTAVCEGFSFFLMSQGPFAPYLENDNPENLNLNAAIESDLIQSNFSSRSGESTIYSVAAALYELANISSTDRVIDIIKNLGTSNTNIFSNTSMFSDIDSAMNIFKEGPIYWKKIWDSISSSEKTKISSNLHYDLSGNSLNYTQYLNLLGIVHCRGIISQVQVLPNDTSSSFSWGSHTHEKRLNIQTFNVSERANANIPIFPTSFNVILTDAENSDLSGERNGLSANNYYGLKIQGGGHNYVSSKMEKSQKLILQYIEIKNVGTNLIADSIKKNLKCSGPGSYKDFLQDFYNSYWNSSNWITMNASKTNGLNSVTIKNLNHNSVYAIRVIATDTNGTTDLLLPGYQSIKARMKTLFDTNSLFFFQTPQKQITDLWISPGRSLQWDYNSAVASSERTIEGYGYYNYLNKEHIAGKNLKINLLLEAGGLEVEDDENKSAKEKEQDILNKVKEIGQGVLLKYDGSILQTAVTDVKRSDEGSDRFIVSYAFKKPGSDGSHLMEAMFTADDENNKAVSFSEGRYLSHSFTVDTVPPDLSLSEKDKTCLDLIGWLVYGKAYDPGDDPSGIGILASWTDQSGYTGYPATGSLDKYKNTPLHYDISVKDFQLGKYDESSFNEYNNVYTNNFIYNPVNGSFQIDDKPIDHAGRLTLVATDKAGNKSSPKTVTWGPKDEIEEDTEEANHFFWKRTDDKICVIDQLNPEISPEITRLKTMNYPSYVANIRTEATGQKDKQDQCVPLSVVGEEVSVLKPFISLKLKNYKFIKGSGSRGENYPGPGGTEIDLSDKYDLYAVKGNPCDIVVSLPLKRVFGENIEAYEGKNILYLETTNGGTDTGREVYSSQSLEFIKSVFPLESKGA